MSVMRYYLVSPLQITHARDHLLTYSSEVLLLPGQIITVQVGKKTVPAVVFQKTEKPTFDTKFVKSILDEKPLPGSLLKLHIWLSSYYASHPVTVWRTMLPSGLSKNRRGELEKSSFPTRQQSKITLNNEQVQALGHILKNPTGTNLLHGITGSGKTAVYIELTRRAVAEGRSVIILVPEIALTSQIVADFLPHFDSVHVTHSTMTEAKRHKLWAHVLHAKTPQVIIGPRSALFMPVPKLGLIIIDECHEPAFKQEKAPRYSAIRAASMLSRFADARLVLGSATPSVADYYLADKTGGSIIELTKSARKDTVMPTISLIDMTKKLNFTRSQFLSNRLIAGLTKALAEGHQALIFHNRRGSAPITLCENCGWSAACSRCFVPLTLHSDEFRLRCHICNYTERIPMSCPSCKRTDIIHKGIGTKRVAEELARLFPEAKITRFDGDNKEGVDHHYQSLYDGEIEIIIGTQVIAKGLDLPKLRFVGVVQADSGLSLPDYQSSERVFQLLAQVAGRVGRNEHPSEVVIQSYQPEHPSVSLGIHQDYAEFYKWCLAERKRAHFPPFTHLLRLAAIYKTEAGAIRASRILITKLRLNLPKTVEIIGPAPAFYERVRDTYRWQIILKSSSRKDLVNALVLLPSAGWQSELDPVSLL